MHEFYTPLSMYRQQEHPELQNNLLRTEDGPIQILARDSFQPV